MDGHLELFSPQLCRARRDYSIPTGSQLVGFVPVPIYISPVSIRWLGESLVYHLQ